MENFAELTRLISRDDNLQVLVFFGPEEEYLYNRIKEKFSSEVLIYDKLNLHELAAAFSCLKVLIGNDTGPLHLGAIIGTPIVLILGKNAPLKYLPLSENISVVRTETLTGTSAKEIFEATHSIMKKCE